MKLIRKWWPTGLVVAVILYATLSPDPAGAVHIPLFPGADKLIHAIMFGGLAGAVAFDWQRANRSRRIGRRLMAAFCAGCVVAGALDEIAQGLLTDGRAAEFLDFVADTAGIAVAYFLAPPAVWRVTRAGRRV